MINLETVGLVAGRGRYPVLLAEEARRHGVKNLVVAGFFDDTDPILEEMSDAMEWIHLGQLSKLVNTFKKRGVDYVIMAGQVTPGKLFKGLKPDLRMIRFMATLKRRNAETIFGGLVEEFAKDSMTYLPATTFMEDHIAVEGVMGKIKPSKGVMQDIEYGRKIARETSRLDIGQTVAVKKGTVLAVEAFEGTDKAILRAGELGRGGVTIVKLAKMGQDMRFDVPCVGMRTVESLKQAGAKALAVEAGCTLFIDKPKVIDALNTARIAVYGFYDADIATTRKGILDVES